MTNKKDFESDLQNNDFLKHIFKAFPMHLYFKDLNGKYRFASDICRKYILRLTGKDLLGKADDELYENQELLKSFQQDDRKVIDTKEHIHFISKVIYEDEITYHDVYKEPVLDSQGNILGILGLVNDITEQKNLEIKQRNLSRIDPLTGLYNRLYYEEQLDNILTQDNLPLAVIVGDTNQLKHLNDTYGHLVGDDLLKLTANILKKSTTGEVFRIGGDEFIILSPNTDEKSCLEIIKNIRRLEESCDAFQFRIKTSLGYAISESVDDHLREIIIKAEKKMYLDKKSN